jgi:hypothetical protein
MKIKEKYMYGTDLLKDVENDIAKVVLQSMKSSGFALLSVLEKDPECENGFNEIASFELSPDQKGIDYAVLIIQALKDWVSQVELIRFKETLEVLKNE